MKRRASPRRAKRWLRLSGASQPGLRSTATGSTTRSILTTTKPTSGRFGLAWPPRAQPLQVVRPDSGPLRTVDQRLTVPELDEAWREGIPNSWSAQRIAVSVLDAHDTAMPPDEVLAFVRARSESSLLKADSAQYWRQSAAIRVRDDGRWELDPTHDAVRSAREAVRERITVVRRWAAMRPDPAAMEANRRRIECERDAHGKELAAMRRVLVHAFPASRPESLVLVDVAERKIDTFIGQEIAQAIHRLAGYEIIGAVGVRPLLQALNVEAGERRLAELGPPQRTKQVNRRGRTCCMPTRHPTRSARCSPRT